MILGLVPNIPIIQQKEELLIKLRDLILDYVKSSINST